MNPVADYRAAVAALLKLQLSIANEFPPDQFEGFMRLMKEIQDDMTEIGLLIGAI